MQLWLSILIMLLLRIFGAVVDAISCHPEVAWWPFHILNWMRRDVIIFILFIDQATRYMRDYSRCFATREDRRFNLAVWFIIFLVANYFLHNIFYAVGIWLRPFIIAHSFSIN